MLYQSYSSEETKNIGAKIAKKYLSKYRVFTLSGNLGAGKTTFVQGFASFLGIKEKIISPTFVLMRKHIIPSSKKTLYHIDLYRLEKKLDINELGIKDVLDNPLNIVMIEWAEKLSNLDQDKISLKFEKRSESVRELLLEESI